MKELSIFIDESGDFGETFNQSPFYIVTLVFHNQEYDISENVTRLKHWLNESNINDKYIHTHPIIRKEYPYNNLNIVVNKREFKNKHSLSANIAKQLSKFTDIYSEYLHQFERIIVYYDNGQNELSYILNVILNAKLSLVEFKNASPISYQLLQVADFLCSMELLKQKHKNNLLTKSEKTFFYKPQELQKNYIKSVEKKKFDS